jgi:hypothetical protein
VPMERRLDYLSFLSGAKMTVPFEIFLVFSTNLNPADLGDEAFLRRIRYKMLLHGPTENEFVRIFEQYCSTQKIACTREMISRFIERHYRRSSRVFRRCHPRDVLTHALNLIHFERLPFQLTDALLDRAFESCFVHDEEDQAVETPILRVAGSCSDFWTGRVSRIPTVFGSLDFIASLRDSRSGQYHDDESARQFGEAETTRVLTRFHTQRFDDWRMLPDAERHRDFSRYINSSENTVAQVEIDLHEWIERLAPPEATIEDVLAFGHELRAALRTVFETELPTPIPEPAAAHFMTPVGQTA